MLRALHDGRLDARAVVVVAHPDDETVSLGGLLNRMTDLTLVHVTDGAPEDMSDARRLGFQDRVGYRQARASELTEALRRLNLSPRRRSFGLADQAAVDALARQPRFAADADAYWRALARNEYHVYAVAAVIPAPAGVPGLARRLSSPGETAA